MRIDRPCSENVQNMSAVPGGLHCSSCNRDVVDLRRMPRKRALAVIAEKHASEGRVCVRVRANEDGTPIFAADPSRFARFAPALIATALTACGASATERPASPIAFVAPPTTPGTTSTGGNANPVPAERGIATVTPRSPLRPASNVQPVIELEMMGEMSL